MPSADEEAARVQLSGVLSKRPVNLSTQHGGLLANKFYRRFFVVKDGFLMYYPESEKREFEKRKYANYHPKGLMPLGDCTITTVAEPDYPYMISIINELSQERLVLLCDNSWEQEKWLDMLEKSSRISWRNAQLGDSVIQQLRVQGDRLAQEKQHAYDQLQDELKALSQEKDKTLEMERLMEAISSEKRRLEETSVELQKQFHDIRNDLETTTSALKELEAEREQLNGQYDQLTATLDTLKSQKKETEDLLAESLRKTSELENCNTELSNQNQQTRDVLDRQISAEKSVRVNLEDTLSKIETELQKLNSEKKEAETKVQEQQELAQLLREEKTIFYEEAKELERSLSDVRHQKEMTELELREEIKARLLAEERLRTAELALQNLEVKVEENSMMTNEQKSQIMKNVKALKRYFEEKAIEEKIEADKPIIMKKAVYNKRKKLRAHSMRIIKSSDLTVMDGQDNSPDNFTTLRIRNSASKILQDKQLRAEIAKTAYNNTVF